MNVPEWGETVYVREMSVGERDAWDIAQDRLGKSKLNNFRSRFLAVVLCDVEGTRLFSDLEASIIETMPAKAIEGIFEFAARVNGLLKADLEEMEKN